MRRLVIPALLLVATAGPSLAQSTAYVPPGGTAGQGVFSGGIVTGGMAFRGPVQAYDRAWGVHYAAAARPDQVKPGRIVYSAADNPIGKVAYADGRVAVVQSPRWAMRLPLYAFGVSSRGLKLDMSPVRFDQLAATYGARR